ncbi:hypothetical protein [Paraburkholderia ginsengiterrae]|nr:hypothetical protein [Paraburkholderia ginsengiterrae]
MALLYVERIRRERSYELFSSSSNGMQSEVVNQIASALRRAAERERLLPYKCFHSLFDPGEPVLRRMAALEKAVTSLGEETCVDYGVLLALDNGLPGDDFFIRFKRNRRDEYVAVMGLGNCGRSITKRRLIAAAERDRVFAHAKRRAADTEAETGY